VACQHWQNVVDGWSRWRLLLFLMQPALDCFRQVKFFSTNLDKWRQPPRLGRFPPFDCAIGKSNNLSQARVLQTPRQDCCFHEMGTINSPPLPLKWIN
jgi:hypothetical protein